MSETIFGRCNHVSGGHFNVLRVDLLFLISHVSFVFQLFHGGKWCFSIVIFLDLAIVRALRLYFIYSFIYYSLIHSQGRADILLRGRAVRNRHELGSLLRIIKLQILSFPSSVRKDHVRGCTLSGSRFQGCQMAIANFLDCRCLALRAPRTMALLRYNLPSGNHGGSCLI